MKTKLQSLLTNLNQGLIERDQTIKLALLTLLAGENMLLVGPPGTGKSLIARRMSESLAKNTATQNNDYFEYLLTKFSTPEEIFGPLSISELKQDRFKRNTAGYLPTVKMAFLDEIFKSSSSILNALLTILNERIYHNGAEVQPVPLRSLIAASNELPNEQEELSALYDRFLVRVFVDYVKEENRQQFFIPAEAFKIQPKLCITEQDLALIAAATAKIKIPDELAKVILNIWEKHKEAFKEDRREDLSDRRLTKVIQLLRVSAATNGRKEMDLSDVFLLKACLWNHPDNARKVMRIIKKELHKVNAVPTYDTQDENTNVAPKNIDIRSKPHIESKSTASLSSPKDKTTDISWLKASKNHGNLANSTKQKNLANRTKQKPRDAETKKTEDIRLINRQKSVEMLTKQLQANIWI